MAQRGWYALALLLLIAQAAAMVALLPHPAAAQAVPVSPGLARTGEPAAPAEDIDISKDAPAQVRLAQANAEPPETAGLAPLQLLSPLQKIGELIQVNAAVRGIRAGAPGGPPSIATAA
jgi:hypothetical protein